MVVYVCLLFLFHLSLSLALLTCDVFVECGLGIFLSSSLIQQRFDSVSSECINKANKISSHLIIIIIMRMHHYLVIWIGITFSCLVDYILYILAIFTRSLTKLRLSTHAECTSSGPRVCIEQFQMNCFPIYSRRDFHQFDIKTQKTKQMWWT